MTHIIGRGRYAREAYPLRTTGIGGVFQVGYDQVIDEAAVVTIPPSVSAFFPRDIAGNPLRVTLPNVTPGSLLEVDFRACLEKDVAYYYIQNEFGCVAFVTFDGAPPVLAPSATVFSIQKSTTGHRDSEVTAEGSPQPIFNITALAGVIIPAGATTAIVQMNYTSTGGVVVSGELDESIFATLKCAEISAVSIGDQGPGILVATGP